MGNQPCQNGLQFCSTTYRSPAGCFKVEKNFRTDYVPSQIKNQHLTQKLEQWRNKSYGEQDKIRSVNGGVGLKESEISFRQQQHRRELNHQEQSPKDPSNLLRSPELLKTQKSNFDIQVKYEDKIVSSNNFEGIFGLITILVDNKVEFTDETGNQCCEAYHPEAIVKTIPMGISILSIQKTLRFKTVQERDSCFGQMIRNHPTSNSARLAKPESYNIPQTFSPKKELVEKENEKTFPGLYGKVVLRADSKVTFTTLIGERISSGYDNEICRVFPMGLRGGGLLKTIWFKEMDDLEDCFCAMKEML